MATHPGILAWRIPWTEEPGKLQPIRLQRVGHEWSEWACTHANFLQPFPTIGEWGYRWSCFPHRQAIPWSQLGCPTIQLNSDTMLLERVSDPTVPQDSPNPYFRCQSQGQAIPRTRLEVTAITSSSSINAWEQLTGLRNILLTRSLVYYKRIKLRNSQMEEGLRARYGEKVQVSMSSPRASLPQCCPSPPTPKLSEPYTSGDFIEASLGTLD